MTALAVSAVLTSGGAMRLISLAAALVLAAGAAHAGQLYKWVDRDGRVNYTDQPPPPEARSAERKRLGDKPGAQGVPFALQEAMRNFPVVMYTASDCGDGCKQASAYLANRGIPHEELDARDEGAAEKLSALTGGKLEVPVMTVGSNVVRGYEEGAWARALDAAGYPSSTVLPRGTDPKQLAAKPQPPAAPPPAGEGNGN
jgi:glutaredoxin